MELVKQTQSWIENIEHRVLFDSWKQFQVVGEGLRNNWSSLSLLTWGCKEEKSGYLLQIIYIDLDSHSRQQKRESFSVFKQHMFELKSVEIGIKDSDVPEICEWLLQTNNDLLKTKFLTSKVAEPFGISCGK